jgi:hypothetical protein
MTSTATNNTATTTTANVSVTATIDIKRLVAVVSVVFVVVLDDIDARLYYPVPMFSRIFLLYMLIGCINHLLMFVVVCCFIRS